MIVFPSIERYWIDRHKVHVNDIVEAEVKSQRTWNSYIRYHFTEILIGHVVCDAISEAADDAEFV